jgi:hypothetical protein
LNQLESESIWCKIKVDKNEAITIGVCYESQAAAQNELENLRGATTKPSKTK